MTYKAIILDIDGTLVDSNDAHARSWQQAMKAYNYDVPYDQIRPLIGMGGDQLLPRVTGVEESSELGEKIAQKRKSIFHEEFLPHLQPFPGVRDLLQRLRDDGYRLLVATSATEEDLKPLLEITGASDLIDDTTSSSDADRSKPNPDIVQAALEKAGVDASDAIMIGDTPYDIQAAARSGVRIIGLRGGGWQELPGALAVYDDPADLLRRYDDSPLRH